MQIRIVERDKAIGERVRLFRVLKGVTRAELAEMLGLTVQQVQKYEVGTNRISAGKLAIIAEYLGVPIADFYDGYTGRSAAEAWGDDAVQELVGHYQAIASRRLQQLLVYNARVLAQEARRQAPAGGSSAGRKNRG